MQSALPVPFASRTTNAAEKNNPQLDLEAMAVDFGLRGYRIYILGAPRGVTIMTDHKPLCSTFNGNRKGSIRTEMIKMWHQDVRFTVEYQKGKLNCADFISRRAKPLDKIPADQQDEVNDLSKLLFMLHTTPIVDSLCLESIASETRKDPILSELSEIIPRGQSWIPKNGETELRKYQQILPEITVSNKGILLKLERMVLPKSLQLAAIKLAHHGSHTRQSGMERRLRSHFFFHDMQQQIKDYIDKCTDC